MKVFSDGIMGFCLNQSINPMFFKSSFRCFIYLIAHSEPGAQSIIFFLIPTPAKCRKDVMEGEMECKRHPLLHQPTVTSCQVLMFCLNEKSKVE